jgi:hypothetical protein
MLPAEVFPHSRQLVAVSVAGPVLPRESLESTLAPPPPVALGCSVLFSTKVQLMSLAFPIRWLSAPPGLIELTFPTNKHPMPSKGEPFESTAPPLADVFPRNEQSSASMLDGVPWYALE